MPAAPTRPPQKPVPVAPPMAHGETPRLLIVDDVAQQRVYLRAILKRSGYEVETADDGVSALALLQKKRFDLVVTDLEMPRMNGMALTAAIRGREETALLPVIMLTGREDLDTKVDNLDAGVDEYITKPGEPREVKARVRSLLRLRNARLELEAKNAALQEALASVREGHKRTVASERVAYAGHLMAGLSHEMNNPLAILMANLEVLRDYATDLQAEKAVFAGNEEMTELIDDLVPLVGECNDAGLRLQSVVGEFAKLQDPPVDNGVPCVAQDILVAAQKNAHETLQSTSAQVQLWDEPLGIVAEPNDAARFLAALIVALARAGEQELAVTTELREDLGRVVFEMHAEGIPWSAAEVSEGLKSWFVGSSGRVTFDVGLAAAQEGLLAMGALLEVHEEGEAWSLRVIFPKEA